MNGCVLTIVYKYSRFATKTGLAKKVKLSILEPGYELYRLRRTRSIPAQAKGRA